MPKSARRYWLFKSEPEAFSIDDLAASPRQTAHWDGVRNYQARNYLRDEVRVGDGVLFYHSSTEPLAIVGTMRVVRAGLADPTAFDPASASFDPKSRPEQPVWFMVDVQLVQKFPEPVTRDMLRNDRETGGMLVLKRGQRLSIQPVTAKEWDAVHRLANVKPRI